MTTSAPCPRSPPPCPAVRPDHLAVVAGVVERVVQHCGAHAAPDGSQTSSTSSRGMKLSLPFTTSHTVPSPWRPAETSWLSSMREPSASAMLTVWASVETLAGYVYRSAHTPFLRRRGEWFERLPEIIVVLWWIPAGTLPTIDEALARLEHLRTHGPTPDAFTFASPSPTPAAR
jgi:hypothetical protein